MDYVTALGKKMDNNHQHYKDKLEVLIELSNEIDDALFKKKKVLSKDFSFSKGSEQYVKNDSCNIANLQNKIVQEYYKNTENPNFRIATYEMALLEKLVDVFPLTEHESVKLYYGFDGESFMDTISLGIAVKDLVEYNELHLLKDRVKSLLSLEFARGELPSFIKVYLTLYSCKIQ